MADLKVKMHKDMEAMSAIFIIIFVALFILANLFYGFIWPLFLVAMTIGFVLAVRFPRSGLLAIVFLTLIFERFFTLQTFFIGKTEYKLYPLDILMVGMILGILLRIFFGGQKLKLKKIDWVLAIFILLNIIYFVASLFIVQSDDSLAFSSLKNYGFYSLLYFMTIFLMRKKEDLAKLFRFFMAGAAGIMMFIFVGIFQGQGLWSEYTPLSTSGIRLLAFTHGFYLSLALLPALIYLVFQRKGQDKTLNILVAIWTFGIIASLMRHLWIAVILVLAMIYFFIPKERKLVVQKIAFNYVLLMAIASVAVFYVLALNPQSPAHAQIGKIAGVVAERAGSLENIRSDESYSWRMLVWNSAYRQFESNPFIGVGTGRKVYVETEDYRDYVEIRNIHNSYLAVLIQLGFLGLIFFLIFVFKKWLDIWTACRKEKGDWQKLSLLAIVSAYLIVLMFQPYLETNLLGIFFWIALGLVGLVAADQNVPAQHRQKSIAYENPGNQQI